MWYSYTVFHLNNNIKRDEQEKKQNKKKKRIYIFPTFPSQQSNSAT